jgi:hypothetical protein
MIRRKWTPEAADEWTREDWITIVISPICYILLMIGMGLSFLLLVEGFVILGIGIALTVLMHWIIDPKLRAISTEYERKQEEYIRELDEKVRWED